MYLKYLTWSYLFLWMSNFFAFFICYVRLIFLFTSRWWNFLLSLFLSINSGNSLIRFDFSLLCVSVRNSEATFQFSKSGKIHCQPPSFNLLFKRIKSMEKTHVLLVNAVGSCLRGRGIESISCVLFVLIKKLFYFWRNLNFTVTCNPGTWKVNFLFYWILN